MDENERLKQIQKLNDYFQNKKIMYNPNKIKRTRTYDNDWTTETKKQYRKEYYQANKEKLKAYNNKKYHNEKVNRGYHTDL